MKKFLTLAAVLVLTTPNAFASKARLLSLGQDPNGSSYIDDTRSVFLNPAYINTVGDFADFEFGSSKAGSTPNSEGGFFHKWGDMHVGAQLGRQTDLGDEVTLANGTVANGNHGTFGYPQNTFEVQVGSGDAYKWGASLIYGMTDDHSSTAGTEYKASTYELRGGLMHGPWDAYVALDMIGSAEANVTAGADAKLTDKPSFKLGGAWDLNADEKLFLETRFIDYKLNSGNGDTDQSATDIKVGYAHFLNPEAATHFFYSAAIEYIDAKLSSQFKVTRIPLVVGIETAATDWLKLRGSVTQNVILDQQVNSSGSYTDNNNPNSTTVAAGVGITWKKVTIDATLAGTNAGANPGLTPPSTATGSGNINATELLANASMTYMF